MKVLPRCLNSWIPVLAAAVAVFTCLPAHATSITYDLTDVTASNGDAVTGTVTIDSITNRVVAADITFNAAEFGDPVFTDIGSPNSWGNIGQDYISGPSNSPLNWGGQIGLYYDTSNIGLGNLAICVLGGSCGRNYSSIQAYARHGGPFDLTGGSLNPVTDESVTSTPVVPEPVSLLLLGTGIVGVALMAHFKLKKA